MKTTSFAFGLAAAVALTPGNAPAHHGKKEEHAQPAAARAGCAWMRAGKSYKSLAACTKGSTNGACKRTCK